MTVERIGPLDPPSNVKKTREALAGRRQRATSTPSTSPRRPAPRPKSSRHWRRRETAPDVRVDKVAEVKRKLQDPSYPSQEVIEKTADGILKSFGI